MNIFNKKRKSTLPILSVDDKISQYIDNGRIPWSIGYQEHKDISITKAINDSSLKQNILSENLPENFGLGLDERIIEYPWIFSNLKNIEEKQILDAGSTFNFANILAQPIFKNNKLTIATYAPESPNFNDLGISYVYTDLRDTPFKDNMFDMVVSHSTIEHIDMDNSIYGYDIDHVGEEKKSYDYLLAVKEYVRILNSEGQLIITFPFGKFENHGFFQQFDSEMLEKINDILKEFGTFKLTFFQYKNNGWIFTSESDCKDVVSFNPHTGKGKAEDGAAHCRSICCINFTKK